MYAFSAQYKNALQTFGEKLALQKLPIENDCH